jgi:cyclic-di-GMP-binding protein
MLRVQSIRRELTTDSTKINPGTFILYTSGFVVHRHLARTASMLQNALAWLATRLPDDPVADLVSLQRYLKQVSAAPMPPEQRIKVLDLFQRRLDAASRVLKHRLIDARLPLQSPLRAIAQGLIHARGHQATVLLRTFREMLAEPTPPSTDASGEILETILLDLAEQQQVALLVATATPLGLWPQAQAAYRLLNGIRETIGGTRAERLLKGMLALAALQPETLTARQLTMLIGYLGAQATAVELAVAPQAPQSGWFWLEASRDAAPVAMARRPAPAHGALLFFSCTELARLTGQHLAQLGESHSAGTDSPDDQAEAKEGYREVLRHALSRWLAPPKRQSPRRSHHYRVELCAQIEHLWSLLHDRQYKHAGERTVPITQWMVLNESASGYAMMHVTGDIDDLVAGEIVGIRDDPRHPWTICLLRWGRSDNEAHIEIGLELIAPSASPVQLANCLATEATLAPSLLLTLPTNSDGDETLFTRCGTLAGKRFILLGEANGGIQLAECEVQRLALQTARVELVAFKRDYSAR